LFDFVGVGVVVIGVVLGIGVELVCWFVVVGVWVVVNDFDGVVV